MLRTTCHCGTVAIAIPRAPARVTNCDCSICRRYGTLWGYFDPAEVRIDAAPGETAEYLWGEKTLAFVRCARCGCVTHWRPLGEPLDRMGVNIRNFEPDQIGPVTIRLLDGAVTETFVGEIHPGEWVPRPVA